MVRTKTIVKVGLVNLMVLFGMSCSHSHFEPGKEYHLSDYIQTIPLENMQVDSAWHIWCGSMVKGSDGKYHQYYSRWPRQTGHEGWINHSEIAYAVSDTPEGPYAFQNVALGAYSDHAWDGAMAHNPYILTANGKYYLYYIATSGKVLSANEGVGAYSTDWWIRRNTQRIGLAVADCPAGPWKRLPSPVLENSTDTTAFDAMCVTNPAVCIGRGGKVVMLYKAVSRNGTIMGGKVRFSVAFADSLEGPFKKSNRLIFQPEDPEARMVAEDPFVWYDQHTDKYYAIVRDVIRQFAGEDSGKLALMESDDAIHWQTTCYPKILPPNLYFKDGTVYDAKEYGVERPFLYMDDEGKPLLLFGAFSVSEGGVHRSHSFNARIPIALP